MSEKALNIKQKKRVDLLKKLTKNKKEECNFGIPKIERRNVI